MRTDTGISGSFSMSVWSNFNAAEGDRPGTQLVCKKHFYHSWIIILFFPEKIYHSVGDPFFLNKPVQQPLISGTSFVFLT